MKFALLTSGSRGNCCLIKHKDTRLVIDCGAARKYLKSHFEQISYNPMQSNALLIAHAHSDHIAQMKLLNPTSAYAIQDIAASHLHGIHPCDRFELQDSRITILPMSHDYEGTVDYVIETEDERMVCVTDTGYIKDEVKKYIRNVDYYIFESNHNIEILIQTTRPVYLERRITGDCGHLCNGGYSNILCDVMGDRTKEIVLAHISQEGNTRDTALTTPKETLKRKQKDREDLRLYPADQFPIYTGGKSA